MYEINPEKLSILERKYKHEIILEQSDCLSKFPIDQYLWYIINYPKVSSYRYISKEVENFCTSFAKYTNYQTLDLFNKLALIKLIDKNNRNILKSNLSSDIISFYFFNFKRIIEELELNTYKGHCLYDNDRFRKDLALCAFRLIPVGARKTHLNFLPMRFLITGGPLKFFERIVFLAIKLKGCGAFYEMHTDVYDNSLKANFNKGGWIKTLIRIADLMEVEPKVKGVYGASWYYDPKILKISPRLSYISEIAYKSGGKTFYLGASKQAIEDATLKSPTRRKLYQEGKYIPTNYLIIWPRKKLMEWANTKKKNED